MCGIAGFSGQSQPDLLKAMNRRLIHRGPDDSGFYSDGKMNLGMTRLSIIDVDHGRQPIANESEDIWAVCNGEIYNFVELRARLESGGHRFRTQCDVEVIVHLYEEYGDDFIHHLNGMFAIAVWDQKKEKLLLVRDRMGVKPLYYQFEDGRLIFASEIKALFEHPQCSREMNPQAILHYFTFKNVPAPLTAFRGIHALNPGTVASLQNGRLTFERWWKIRYDRQIRPTPAEAAEAVLGLLEDATRIRMRSDVPFGAFLSGGLDSSLIVGLMTRYSSQPIQTFSLGYEKELTNKVADLQYARRVAQIFGTRHHEHIMSHQELVNDIGHVTESLDQPFSGTISTYFLSRLIGRHVKVALAGDGADELFGSYLSHRIAQPMRSYAGGFASGAARFGDDPKDYQKHDIHPDLFQSLFAQSAGRDHVWRYHLGVFTDEEKSEMLTSDFLESCGGSGSLQLLESRFKELTSDDPLNRILEAEWNTQLPDNLLLYADALSMAHSVELRSPFLDYRLVEYAASLPGDLKIRDGNIKDVLKLAAGALLPAEIIDRKKEGFVLPVHDWIQDDLREFCYDTLSSARVRKSGVVRPEYAQFLIEKYYSGDRRYAPKIWSLLMFQIWWERHFS